MTACRAPVPSRPVSSPSRLLVPLGDGWDARPCPSTTDPSQLRRGQVCRSTASIAGGGRASARWPPTHRYLEQGICKSAQVPPPVPVLRLSPRVPAVPALPVPLAGPRGRSAAAGLLPERVAERIPSGWVGSQSGAATGRAEGVRPPVSSSVTQPRGPAEWSPHPGADLQGGCGPGPVRAWPGAKPVTAARRAIQALNLAVHDCMVCGVPVKPTDNANPAFSLSSYSNPCCKCAT